MLSSKAAISNNISNGERRASSSRERRVEHADWASGFSEGCPSYHMDGDFSSGYPHVVSSASRGASACRRRAPADGSSSSSSSSSSRSSWGRSAPQAGARWAWLRRGPVMRSTSRRKSGANVASGGLTLLAAAASSSERFATLAAATTPPPQTGGGGPARWTTAGLCAPASGTRLRSTKRTARCARSAGCTRDTSRLLSLAYTSRSSPADDDEAHPPSDVSAGSSSPPG
mmetsp:Transcript_5503/g.22808  ORF Transcript_5503/g.22808 Transcript_5503/m.22808 type:complete len:229 (+) Transcript_5503:671-1357(+)